MLSYLPQAPRELDQRSVVGLHIDCILYLNLRQESQSQSEVLKRHMMAKLPGKPFGIKQRRYCVVQSSFYDL